MSAARASKLDVGAWVLIAALSIGFVVELPAAIVFRRDGCNTDQAIPVDTCNNMLADSWARDAVAEMLRRVMK